MRNIRFESELAKVKQKIMNKRYLSILLATLGVTISFAPIAKAEYIERVECSSTGQVCDKTADYTFEADGSSSYVLNIKAPNRHCSAIKYSLKWSDAKRSRTATTRFLNREESATIRLGNKFASGQQVITIGATGKEGGCNSGALLAWGVEVTATPKSTPQPSPSTPQPSESTPQSSESTP
jgi:hypothetical protein